MRPEALLLQGTGTTHELTLLALDEAGHPVDPEGLALELTSSNPEEVSATWDGYGRVTVRALRPAGSAFLLVRSTAEGGPTSNPVTALVATVKPGVEAVADAEVVFPPPNASAEAQAGSGGFPDISSPDPQGRVRIGSFSDEEVAALYEPMGEGQESQTLSRTAVVLRGEPPAPGTLLVASEGSTVAGRVVRAELREGFSLVQLEQVPLQELFQDLHLRLGSEMLPRQSRAPQQPQQPPQCTGWSGLELSELAESTMTAQELWHLELDVAPGGNRRLLLKAGAHVKGQLRGRLKFDPDREVDFACSLPPEAEIGPVPIAGPLAAYLHLGLRFQPFLRGQARLVTGPPGEIKAGLEFELPLIHGLEWVSGSGARLFREGEPNFTPTFATEGLLFTAEPDMLLAVDVSGQQALGINGNIHVGGRAPPGLERFRELIARSRLDLVELQGALRLDARWLGVEKALQEGSDEGILGTKVKVDTALLPGASNFITGLMGRDTPLTGTLPPQQYPIWQHTALRRGDNADHRARIRMRSGDGSWVDAPSTLLIRSGDSIDVEVVPTPAEDEAQGIYLFRMRGSTPERLVEFSKRGDTWRATWSAPAGSLSANEQERQQLHIAGYNKAGGIVPMGSHLGILDLLWREECPNEEITDVCFCPQPPPDCEEGTPPPVKYARAFRPPVPPVPWDLSEGDFGYGWGGGGGGGGGGGDLCFGCPWPAPGPLQLSATSWGDPHIGTFDRRTWTSYALGEFWLLHPRQDSASPVDGAPQGVEVQARHQRLPGFAGWASFNTAVAMRAGGYTFEVRMPRETDGSISLDRRRALELLINGQQVTLNPQAYVISDALSFRVTQGNGLEVTYRDPTVPQPVRHPEEVYTRVRIGTRGEESLLRTGGDPQEPVLSIDVAVETVGPYVGLLGTPDGRAENDFTTLQGSVLNKPNLEFVNSFRVLNRARSLFTYAPGEGPGTFSVPQTSTLPAPSELGPYITRLRTLLTETCGVSEARLSEIESAFLEQLAYELAAGRTERNMIASGLCTDASLLPETELDYSSLLLTGRVTVEGRPDVGIVGARVRIVHRQSSRVLCDMVTLSDGRYGCGVAIKSSELASSPTMTLDYRVRVMGDERTSSVELPTPEPNTRLTQQQDFESAVAVVLDVRGRVRDAQGVPMDRTLVRLSTPLPMNALTNERGEYQRYVVLPEGMRRATVRLQALSPDGRQSGTAEADVVAPGPGIQTVTLDVDMLQQPGSLPPLQSVPTVRVYGTLRNTYLLQEPRLSAGLQGTTVRILRRGTSEELCTVLVSNSDGRWECAFRLPEGHAGPLELVVGADGLPSATRELSLAEGELPSPGQVIFRTVELTAAPTTLIIEGRATTPSGAALGGVEINFETLAGLRQSARTSSDGSYRTALSLPFETEFSGPLAGKAALLGAESGGRLEVRTTDVVRIPARAVQLLARNFTFTSGVAVLSGRVLNALVEDAPLPGALVRIMTSDQLLCEARTDAQGLYACSVSSAGGGVLPITYLVSDRGHGTFTEFDGEPARLDLSSIPAATIRPVLPTRDLRARATTLRVTGMVRDAAGAPVAGALVGATADSGGTAQVYSGEDGAFTLLLPLDEGVQQGRVHLSTGLFLPGVALTARAEPTFVVSAPHALVDVPASLTLDGTLPADTSAARLRFTGQVRNGRIPGTPVGAARVEVRLRNSSAPLCEVTTNSDGSYVCPILLMPAPPSPAEFEYRVQQAGVPLADPEFRSWSFTRSAVVETQLPLDLVVQPPSLEVHGRVLSEDMTPLVGAHVELQGTGLGAAVTDAQGYYQLVSVLPPAATELQGTLTVSVQGMSLSRTLHIPLEAGGLTRQREDFRLTLRRIGFSGTVQNLLAEGTLVREAVVELRHSGTVFCQTALQQHQEGRFSCPNDLVLSEGSPTEVEWTARNALGQRTGTISLSSDDIPPAGQRRVLERTLSLPATTLRVQGTVRDTRGQLVAGAQVLAAAHRSHATAMTATDGSYSLLLVLPDVLPDSQNGQPATDLDIQVRLGADMGRAGGLVAAPPGELTTVTRDVNFATATRLHFSGTVVNLNADERPIQGATIRVIREGMHPLVSLLCEAEADSNGRFSCSRSLYGESLDSLSVRYQVLLQGTRIAEDTVRTYTVQPGASGGNSFQERLGATPTTIRVVGAVRDPDGAPMAQVSVSLQQVQDVSSSTDTEGRYSLVLPLPTGTALFQDTVVARREDVVVREAVSLSPLADGRLNEIRVDLTLVNRRIIFFGLVSNQWEPTRDLPSTNVRLRTGGQFFCETWTSAGQSNSANYSCGWHALNLTDDSPLEIAWEVTGRWGSAQGTRALAQTEIPEPGRTSWIRLDMLIPVTMLEVSGRVLRGETPEPGVRVVLSRTGREPQTGWTTTDAEGRYTIRMPFTADVAQYEVTVSARLGWGEVSESLSGSLAQGEVNQLTQNLTFPADQPGGLAWVRQLTTSPPSQHTPYAPALLGTDLIIVPDGAHIRTLRVDDGSEQWSASLGNHVTSAIVVGEDGAVYVGDQAGVIHAFNSSGTLLWRKQVRSNNYANSVTLLALDEERIYVAHGFHVTALRTSDGAQIWQADGAWPASALVVAPDGTLVVASTYELKSFRYADGLERWRVSTHHPSTPALTPDGHILFHSDSGLKKLDLNGQEVWSLGIGNRVISAAPAVARDGTSYILSGNSLVKVSPAGVELARVTVPARPSEESLHMSSPVLGEDGSLYIGASASQTQESILYAVGADFSVRWSYRVPIHDGFRVPTLIAGKLLASAGNHLYALNIGGSGGMAQGGWARLHGDGRNSSRAPPAPYWELLVKGSVLNLNRGDLERFPLPDSVVELRRASNGALLARGSIRPDGSYHLSAVFTEETAVEVTLSVERLGYTARQDLHVEPGAPGSVVELVRDFTLAVMTLELKGVVRSGGAPLGGVQVVATSDGGVEVLPASDTSEAGAFTRYHIYPAAAPLTTSLAVRARKWPQGLALVQNRSVSLTQAGLTTITQDLDLVGRTSEWSLNLPEGTCWPDGTIVAPGGHAYVDVRYCTSGSTPPSHGLIRVSRDGRNMIHSRLGGQWYYFTGNIPLPVIGGDGRVYVGGDRLVALSPELEVLGTFEPGAGGYVSRPVARPSSNGTAEVFVPLTNGEGGARMLGLGFTPATGVFMPLWSVDFSTRFLPQTLPVFGSSMDVVYLAENNAVVTALSLSADTSSRILFNRRLVDSIGNWPLSRMAVWASPAGDQIRLLNPHMNRVWNLDTSGADVQGWPHSIGQGSHRPTGGDMAVSSAGNTYFLAAEGRVLWAISPDGTARWSFENPWRNDESNFHWGVATDSTGRIYVATERMLLALDDATTKPTLAWGFRLNNNSGTFTGPPAVGDTAIIMTTSARQIISIPR